MDIKIEINAKQNGKFIVDCLSSNKTFSVDVGKEISLLEGPNPLELFLSALGSCVAVYAEKYLIQHSVEFKKLKVEAVAGLSIDSPSRLVDIKLKVYTDALLDKDAKEVFLRFMKNCPIHNTVINTKEISVSIV
ncbi:MAG: OsmC family protein [Candidatus Omnitrophota bacterium]|jgi:uncharacterized OsmC-like protein